MLGTWSRSGNPQSTLRRTLSKPKRRAFANDSDARTLGRSGTAELLHAATTSEQLCGGALPRGVHKI